MQKYPTRFPLSLLAASLLPLCNGKVMAAPAPVIDTDAPTVITITNPGPSTLSSTRPVITLDMATEIASQVVATDAPDTGSPSSDFPGYPKGKVGPLGPGRHTIIWTATDLGNNSLNATQNIDVEPEINFAVDQTVGDGNNVNVKLYLSGAAPAAVTIPFEVVTVDPPAINCTGYSISGGTPSPRTIAAGDKETDITITTTGSNSDGCIIKLKLTQTIPPEFDVTGATVGINTTHTITLKQGNLAPVVTISATQGSGTTHTVTNNGGLVTFTANFKDPNGDGINNYDWSASDNALVPTNGTTGSTFIFSPVGMTPGVYTARLTVRDDFVTVAQRATSTRDYQIRIVASPPSLSATTDSDDDGTKDLDEGYQDSDGDGIPNYLDAVSNPAWLPGWELITYKADLKRSDSFVSGPITFDWKLDTYASNRVYYPLLLATEPGLKLSIGLTAFASGSNNGRITTAAASLHFGSSPGKDIDGKDFISADGQVVDVEITGLGTTGQSVYLVIPQTAPLPPGSPTFKVIGKNQKWQDFTVDSKNTLLKAGKDSDNYCPPPADANYTSGALSSGVSCIELLIQDGGPNDYDGKANGTIRLLGAPFVTGNMDTPITTPSDSSGPGTGSEESLDKIKLTEGGGGIGFTGLWGIAGLLLANWRRRRC